LKDNELWWHGPEFLGKTRDKWPEERLEEQFIDTKSLAELRVQQFASVWSRRMKRKTNDG
jgi:hypothetical protein